MLEKDIRPADLHNAYLELSKEDARFCFEDVPRYEIDCVACGSNETNFVFQKFGFDYRECASCKTVFQSSRPEKQAFDEFYKNSASSAFWANDFFPAVLEARREKIFQPRVERLREECAKLGIQPRKLIDIGAGHGVFLEEWQKANTETSLLAVEPSDIMADICRQKGFEVIESTLEELPDDIGDAGLVTSFEVLEHVFDPLDFVLALRRVAGKRGAVFLSTLCVDGFDIQTLWQESKSISPPHHLNFLSIEGFKHLFNRAGMDIVDITTPGKLDLDIVANYLKENAAEPDAHLFGSKFIARLNENPDLATKFQTFLSENLLSSHVWIFGRPKEM